MRLIEVALFTPDVGAVAAFYRDLLGLPPDAAGPEKAQFQLGEVTLLLHEDPGAGLPGAGRPRSAPRADPPRSASAPPPEAAWPPDGDHVAFAVDDLAAACGAARARGVLPVAGPREYPWGRSAYFRDPDGRLVELHEKS